VRTREGKRILKIRHHLKILRLPMIISPWSRANVVNKQFIEQLEKLLKRDVQLLIGYG
jgi:predicted transcriptional regulator